MGSFFHKATNKICRALNIVYVYETKYGIKLKGSLFSKSDYVPVVDTAIKKMNPCELYLYEDYLKDDYSLLGIRLVDSPHFDIFNKNLFGEDISKSEYLKRRKNGSLDTLNALSVNDKTIVSFKKKFESRYNNIILHQDYSPIFVLEIGGKIYIFDGKHRAAMCAVHNIKVNCIVLNKVMMIRKTCIYNLMLSNSTKYTKHLILAEQLFNESKCVERKLEAKPCELKRL